MHKKFEINQTKIKGSCQSGRKVVTHDSKSDLPLSDYNVLLTILNLISGTPPRIRKSTISFENLTSHNGDDPPVAFSYLNDMVWLERENISQLPCYMTRTNDKIHQIIMDNMHQNRHVSEEITVRISFFLCHFLRFFF